MSHKTEALFRADAFLREAEAHVVGATAEGGILLDRTIFYATSGGQPGDVGQIERDDGSFVAIAGTVTGASKDEIVHVPADGAPRLSPGEHVRLWIDWDRRFKLMRMHTACHLLSVVCPYPITGASVGEDESRVDFDIPEAGMTKEAATEGMMRLVEENHPVFTQWITDEEFLANPSIVRSKNVRPPVGQGRIRLVMIGENGAVDSQPCSGTHVAFTGEVGPVHVGKIEKKGRENRRFRIRFGRAPES